MAEKEILAERFETNREHLRAVAHRMLGSRGDAEDAVQEAWLRLARADTSGVDNLKAWLTTVVARVSLDMLRSRKTRREEPIAEAETFAGHDTALRDVEVADSVGLAMLIVLEALTPAERVAFVLHDMFDLSFDDIAPIIRRSPVAARKLASRARQRVQDGAAANAESDRARRREVISAFLAASQGGDFSALLAVLDPEVLLRSDASVVAASLAGLGDAPPLAPEIRGAQRVAEIFKGRARAARHALVDGEAGLVIAFGDKPRMVFEFVVEGDRIVEISLIADAQEVEALDLQF